MSYYWRHWTVEENVEKKSPKYSSPSSLLQFHDQYFEDHIICQSDSTNSPLLASAGIRHCSPDFLFLNRAFPEYSLHYILGGKGWVGDHQVKTGDVVFFQKNQLQNFSSDAEEPCYYAWLTFKGDYFKNMLKSIGIPRGNMIYSTKNLTKICQIFYDMLYTDHPDHSTATWLDSCLLNIISLSAPPKENDPDSSGISSRNQGYIDHAIEYIGKNYNRPDFRIEKIGQEVGFSNAYLRALFKRALGKSPKQYLDSCRIEAAITMLSSSNYAITEISELTGFRNYQRFFELFRKQTGKSPSEYRKMKN